MPDDELLAAADAGTLTDKPGLLAQVTRMLASPKAAALVDNFAGQWLHIRKLDDHEPDYNVFPGYDPALRDAMRTETELMFRDLLAGTASANQLLTADFTYVNDRLAKHYGLPAPGSADHKRVSLLGTKRGGLLTQASMLTVTSYPARTSPVQRGRWVLEQLLCEPPPAPPPGVEGLQPETMPTGTLRQRTEQHRANPTCAACHNHMDPIGFGLENYDGIGAYRTTDSGFDIDASGKLPDGRTFTGAQELSRLLAEDARFTRCMTEQLYVYALGRGPVSTAGHMDPGTLASIAQSFSSGGFKLQNLIEMVVTADTFRKRRGEPDAQGGAP
jgi:hypothetical protein